LDAGKQIVIRSVARLYEAGYVSMPAAASLYDTARKICADANIDGLRTQFPRSVAKFHQAATEFGDELASLQRDFNRYVDAMVTAAKDDETADTVNAEAIQQPINSIPQKRDTDRPDDRQSPLCYQSWLQEPGAG
jgi:hypothetical protein